MLHVRSLSGDPVAELHVKELKAKLQETEELLVVALKRFLGAQLGCSRFRLKLLGEDSRVIDDDALLTGPADFTLVRMDFQASDVATNEAFISACGGGHVSEVERLLHAPQDPDAREAKYNSAGIHKAAWNGHLAVLRLLLEAGANKDAAGFRGVTALHLAAENGQLDVVQLLLEAGADTNATRESAWRPLHMAAANGHWAIVRLLHEAGADKDAAMRNGTTALSNAAHNGQLDVVRLLLDAGSRLCNSLTQGGLWLFGRFAIAARSWWRLVLTRMQRCEMVQQL